MRRKTFKKVLLAGSFCAFLFAGAATIDSATASAAAPVTSVVMTDGGSVRYFDAKDETDYSGIRFEATIDLDYIANNPTATYGMLIMPTALLEGELTEETKDVVDIPVVPNQSGEIYGVLYDIPVAEYATELSARAYVKKEGAYTLSDLTTSRSIAQVASLALAQGNVNETQVRELNYYVDGANATIDVADVHMTVDGTFDLSNTLSNEKLVAKYTVTDEEVLRLEDGKITALRAGESAVNITLGSKQATLPVEVVDPDGAGTLALAENGETQYRVVKPFNASETVSFACDELVSLFYEATGARLEVISDKYLVFNERCRYISVGDTAIKQDFNVVADKKELKTSGTRMVTKGNSIVLTGAEDYGTLYSVYDFLQYLFDYEYYDVDAYALTKKAFVELPTLDETNIPDFEYRHFGDYQQYTAYGGDDDHAHRLRILDMEGNSALDGHTATQIIDPNVYGNAHSDWFAPNGLKTNADGSYSVEKSYLCYSNEEMRAEYIKNVKGYLQAKPNATSIALTQSDINEWCDCAACTATMAKYASNGKTYAASTQILFLNQVVSEVNAWLAQEYPNRHVWYVTYAYHQTIEAPAHKDSSGNYVPNGSESGDYSMLLHEDICVQYADIYADRNKSFKDNEEYAEIAKGWAALTSNLSIYEYGQDAFNVCLPYDGMYVHGDNIRFAKELGFDAQYKIQGNYRTMSSGFYYLRVYVTSKLTWDTTLDEHQLAENYITNVYGEAAPAMKGYYDALREKLADLRARYPYGSMCLFDGLKEAYWDKATIDSFQGYIDEAYEAIAGLKTSDAERYEVLLRKIKIEEMFLRYVNLSLYRDQITNKQSYIDAFEADAEKYGFTRYHETKPMSEKIAEWRQGEVDYDPGRNDIYWS